MAGHETAAVLGAGGTMGFPMARNLARSGFSVRRAERGEQRRREVLVGG